MKKQLSEPDFIGGQGSLTQEEELALSAYFAKKKAKQSKRTSLPVDKTKYMNQV
ncbi:hypothetical protein GCM10028803_16930 [Larkinella knui]|uniref:hypothetical protein n=1 Tax=Larkinella knui TaxID=2025310 RepID=UPI00163B0F86|nr:hypothetical protein [Larkinella knui]